jgi:hypothetical protein
MTSITVFDEQTGRLVDGYIGNIFEHHFELLDREGNVIGKFDKHTYIKNE